MLIKLTFRVKQKSSNSLESEIVRHELSYFSEQASKVPLSANLRRQLQRIDNCLFLLVNFLSCSTSFQLHCDKETYNFDDLLICRVKPNKFIFSFHKSRLKLNYQQNLRLLKQNRRHQELLALDSKHNFIQFLECRQVLLIWFLYSTNSSASFNECFKHVDSILLRG